MSLFTKFTASLPLAFAIVGFTLSTLSLSAGHQEGFMEEYAIARLNISGIGYGILQRNDDRDKDKDNSIGFLDSLNDAKNTVLDKVDDAIGDVTSSAMHTLNIPDWYSIHITKLCYGSFKLNRTGKSASLNVTKCTKGSDQFNFEAMVKKELTKISLPIDTESLELSTVQKKLNIINNVLSGLLGKEIGISAERGSKFLAISWAAACVMFVSTVSWITTIRRSAGQMELE